MKWLTPNLARNVVIAVLSIASIGVVVWFALKAPGSIDFHNVVWPLLIAAFVLQVLLNAAFPVLWIGLLWVLGHRHVNSVRLFQAFSRSWLARYVPGRVFALGGRMFLARRVGLPVGTLAYSMALEIFFSYGVITVLGAALLLAVFVNLISGIAAAVAGIICLVFAANRLFKIVFWVGARGSRGLSRLLSGRMAPLAEARHRNLSAREITWAIVSYGVHDALQLAVIILVSRSLVSDLTAEQTAVIAGAWALSAAIGYVSFFTAAAGIGVRDGVALGIFASVIDAPVAAAIVAAARIVMVGSDFAFVGLAELAALLIRGKKLGRENPVEGQP